VTAIRAVTKLAETTASAPALDAVTETVRHHDHPAVNEAAVPYLLAASRADPDTVADHAAVFGELLETGFPSDHDGAPAVTLGHWEEVNTIIATLGHLVDSRPEAVVPAAGGLLAWAAGNLGQASVRYQLMDVLTAAVVPDAPFGGRSVNDPLSVAAVEPTGHARGLAPHVDHLLHIVDRRSGLRGEWALLYAIALESPSALAAGVETVLNRWAHGVGTREWLYATGSLAALAEQDSDALRPHVPGLLAAAAQALSAVDRLLSDATYPLSGGEDHTTLRALWCVPTTLSVVASVARTCPDATDRTFGDAALRQRVRDLGAELWVAVPTLVEAAAEAPPAGAVVVLELLAAVAAASGAFVVHHTETLRAIRAEADDERVRAATTAVLQAV
jgi:hypothetical protein